MMCYSGHDLPRLPRFFLQLSYYHFLDNVRLTNDIRKSLTVFNILATKRKKGNQPTKISFQIASPIKNSRHHSIPPPLENRNGKEKNPKKPVTRNEKLSGNGQGGNQRNHARKGWPGFREARGFDEGRDRAKDNGCLAVALSTTQSRSLRSMQH